MASLRTEDRIVDRDELKPQVTVHRMRNVTAGENFQEVELEYPAMIDVRRFDRQTQKPLAPRQIDSPDTPGVQPSVQPKEQPNE